MKIYVPNGTTQGLVCLIGLVGDHEEGNDVIYIESSYKKRTLTRCDSIGTRI
jgi:hypothetical protein